jgi:hypothetical protein
MPIAYEGPVDDVISGYMCIPFQERASGWKITRFGKTPLVSRLIGSRAYQLN